MFAQHAVSDAADPQYIAAYNEDAYRYYAFKFADNYGGTAIGVRRIELKPPKNIPFNGLMDEFRVSKNVARWTANFTPPIVAYPLGSSGGNVDYAISSPYNESDFRDIYFVQSADTLFLTHPDYAPRSLVREAHDDWTLDTITFAWPPFRSTNATSTYLTPNAASVGAVSINASTSLFDDTYVGAYLKLNSGYMNIASVQSATTCSGTIMDEFTNSASTASWAVSAWDEISGYPSCVTFFEQRLCFAGTDVDEATVWMSVSGDYYNFNQMVGSAIADTDACTYAIDADEVNKIVWMGSAAKLFLGTVGDVFMMSGNQDDGITPTNIKCRSAAAEHSEDEIMPVRFGNSILFVERGGKIVRELSYDFQEDAYKAKDLIILAEHLTRNTKILKIALQRLPFKVLWCMLDDGTLLLLTHLKEHDVIGWAPYDCGGIIEDMAIIPGDTDDEVFMIVRRTVDGSTVRYIERAKPQFDGTNINDAFYVDCGLTYSGVAATTISGLDHLIGETVSYLAAGINESSVINAAGNLVMDTAATPVQIGLPIETNIKTLRVSPPQSQGKPKRISYVTIRFFETAGEVQLGVPGKMDTINLGTSLFTGDHRFTFPSGYDKDGQISITKTDAYPMTILAIVPDIEMYRD